MAGVAGMKRLRSSEHAVANGAAAASSRIRVARLPVPGRERRHERLVDSSTSAAVSVIGSSPERGLPVEWRGRGSSGGGSVLVVVDAALLDRAGELKRELLAFSRQPRYDRAFSEVLAQHGGSEVLDEYRLMMLWDYFVLEHRLRGGRTIVEQFVDAHAELSRQEREMLLGWRDVVQGPFEVQRRDGPALIVVNLVDDLTYRVRSNMGTSVFRQMPRRSFLITRLVPVGEEWMLSGPTSVLRPAEREVAYRLAFEMSMRTPEAVYRSPEKLARAWEMRRADRQRFVGFFGADLVLVPGDQAQERLNRFHEFCRDEVLRTTPGAARRNGGVAAPVVELPLDLVESETVAMIYDERDGLGFYAEFGLVEEAFADPDLVRRRRVSGTRAVIHAR